MASVSQSARKGHFSRSGDSIVPEKHLSARAPGSSASCPDLGSAHGKPAALASHACEENTPGVNPLEKASGSHAKDPQDCDMSGQNHKDSENDEAQCPAVNGQIWLHASLGALFSWKGMEAPYLEWRFQRCNWVQNVYFVLDVMQHLLLFTRVLSMAVKSTMSCSCMLPFIISMLMRIVMMSSSLAQLAAPRRLLHVRGYLVVTVDALAWLLFATFFFVPSGMAGAMKAIMNAQNQTKPKGLAAWYLHVRTVTQQLPPPWLFMDTFALLSMQWVFMSYVCPNWLAGDANGEWQLMPGWLAIIFSAGSGLVVAVFIDVVQRVRYLKRERITNESAGTALNGNDNPAQQKVDGDVTASIGTPGIRRCDNCIAETTCNQIQQSGSLRKNATDKFNKSPTFMEIEAAAAVSPIQDATSDVPALMHNAAAETPASKQQTAAGGTAGCELDSPAEAVGITQNANTGTARSISEGAVLVGSIQDTAGSTQVIAGSSQVTASSLQLAAGCTQVTAGSAQVTAGSPQVTAGSTQVAAGSTQAHVACTAGCVQAASKRSSRSALYRSPLQYRLITAKIDTDLDVAVLRSVVDEHIGPVLASQALVAVSTSSVWYAGCWRFVCHIAALSGPLTGAQCHTLSDTGGLTGAAGVQDHAGVYVHGEEAVHAGEFAAAAAGISANVGGNAGAGAGADIAAMVSGLSTVNAKYAGVESQIPSSSMADLVRNLQQLEQGVLVSDGDYMDYPAAPVVVVPKPVAVLSPASISAEPGTPPVSLQWLLQGLVLHMSQESLVLEDPTTCIMVVVSLPGSNTPLLQQSWSRTQLLELPVDEHGEVRLLVSGLATARLSSMGVADWPSSAIISVLRQFATPPCNGSIEHHKPDHLISTVVLPMLPTAAACSEMADVFQCMVVESQGNYKTAYAEHFRPLACDLANALSPAAAADFRVSVGIDEYACLLQHLLLFSLDQQLHCVSQLLVQRLRQEGLESVLYEIGAVIPEEPYSASLQQLPLAAAPAALALDLLSQQQPSVDLSTSQLREPVMTQLLLELEVESEHSFCSGSSPRGCVHAAPIQETALLPQRSDGLKHPGKSIGGSSNVAAEENSLHSCVAEHWDVPPQAAFDDLQLQEGCECPDKSVEGCSCTTMHHVTSGLRKRHKALHEQEGEVQGGAIMSHTGQPLHLSWWHVLKGVVLGWEHCGADPAVVSAMMLIHKAQLQQHHWSQVAHIVFDVVANLVVLWRFVAAIWAPSSPDIVPSIILVAADRLLLVICAVVQLSVPHEWLRFRGQFVVAIDVLVFIGMVLMALCPLGLMQGIAQVLAVQSVSARPSAAVAWYLMIRTSLMQLSPPWLALDAGLWLAMLSLFAAAVSQDAEDESFWLTSPRVLVLSTLIGVSAAAYLQLVPMVQRLRLRVG